jgi:hypothetical protein
MMQKSTTFTIFRVKKCYFHYDFACKKVPLSLRYAKKYFFYNCQKNVTFMHRYQVAKYVIFDSEKIFVKKFPWMLK